MTGTDGPPAQGDPTADAAATGATDRPGASGATVHIGSVANSALTFGAHSTATTTNVSHGESDTAQRELLAAVRALRADLARFVSTPDTEVLDAELVATEEEITASGEAGRPRLERLRSSLASAGEWAGALGSGVAVAELVAALLGG